MGPKFHVDLKKPKTQLNLTNAPVCFFKHSQLHKAEFSAAWFDYRNKCEHEPKRIWRFKGKHNKDVL